MQKFSQFTSCLSDPPAMVLYGLKSDRAPCHLHCSRVFCGLHDTICRAAGTPRYRFHRSRPRLQYRHHPSHRHRLENAPVLTTVSRGCCHPSGCTVVTAKQPCNLMCTASCEGPLDCGAGSCGCVKGKCSVVPASSVSPVPADPTAMTIKASPLKYSPVMSSTPGIGLEPVVTGFMQVTQRSRGRQATGTSSRGILLISR